MNNSNKLMQESLIIEARTDRQHKMLDSVATWASYYRANPHRFASDFLHLDLMLFQKILLFMMNVSNAFVFIASRGLGKTFLSAIFCVVRCILYPGTQICIASGTRGQSLQVIEKIITILMPNSPELRYEIDDKQSKSNSGENQLVFKNGSYIKVVTSSDNARSNRANILILDEFRQIKREVINTILRKFLTNPRRPKYLDIKDSNGNKIYGDDKYQERNKTLYLSSAYFKDHWSFSKTRDVCKLMLDDKHRGFVCGFPYQLALSEGLLLREDVEEEMSETDFNEISWSMEMGALFWGDSDGSFFGFASIAKNRNIKFAMLPDELSIKLPEAQKMKISHKQPGEIRILSLDVALMATKKHKNDAAAIYINQVIPTKAGRYSNNFTYSESVEGALTQELALKARKMYDEFFCDYMVMDCGGNGAGVYDLLVADMNDPDTGEVYPALSCCNNQEMADRCVVPGAPKVIWSVKASAGFNSECARLLREGFAGGRVRLLDTEVDAEVTLSDIKGYNKLSMPDRMKFLMPYINTTLLIGELIGLDHDVSDSTNLIRVKEKTGKRKDRYSSVSYSYWVAIQLERQIKKRANNTFNSTQDFVCRPPKIYGSHKNKKKVGWRG